MKHETRMRWSALTDRELRAAGWYPGRSVSVDEWEKVLREQGGFAIHEAARRFLAEFGGLQMDLDGPGQTMVRARVRLDPLAAESDREIFEDLSEEAGVDLYPIGETEHRNNYLGIAPNGAVYIGMDDVRKLAETADRALEKLMEGIR